MRCLIYMEVHFQGHLLDVWAGSSGECRDRHFTYCQTFFCRKRQHSAITSAVWESVLFPTVLPKSLLFSFYIFVSLIGETSNFVLLLNLLVSLRVHFSQFYLFFFFFSEALFIFGRLAFSVRTVFRLTVPSSLQSQFSMPSLTPRGLDQSVQWLGVRGRTKTAPLQP